MSILIPQNELRRVIVDFDPQPKHALHQVAYLGPDPEGRQTLFVHTHLADAGLPEVIKIADYDTGEIVRVSESWLSAGSKSAGIPAATSRTPVSPIYLLAAALAGSLLTLALSIAAH